MKRINDAPDTSPTMDAQATTGRRARQPWVRPRLVRVGSVAQVTAKVDMVGVTDGGAGSMSRT